MPHKIIQPDGTAPNRHGLIGVWGLSLLLHGVFVFMLLSMKIHSPSNHVILSSIIPVSLIEERPTPMRPVSVKKYKNISSRLPNDRIAVAPKKAPVVSEKTDPSTVTSDIKIIEAPREVYEPNRETNFETNIERNNTEDIKADTETQTKPETEVIIADLNSSIFSNRNTSSKPENEFGFWQLKPDDSENHLKADHLKNFQKQVFCEQAIKQMDLSINRAVKPCHRPAFKVPDEGLLKSGYCRVEYDINLKGRPENIDVIQCTNEQLRKPSIKAVKGWYFFPKVHDGKTEYHYDQATKLTLRVSDQHGNLLNADLLLNE